MKILYSVLKNIFTDFAGQAKSAAQVEVNNIHFDQQRGGTIIAFIAASEGNALYETTKAYLSPLSSKASNILYIDVNSPEWINSLFSKADGPIWFACSYFAVGQSIDISIDGEIKNLWEHFGIPFLRIYGDNPCYFPDKHLSLGLNSINAYGYTEHQHFYRTWFSKPATSILLPPIIIESRPSDCVQHDIKLNGNILFPKNGNDPNALIDYWRMALPRNLSTLLQALAEDAISTEKINTIPAIDVSITDHFTKTGVDPRSIRPQICFLTAQLDDYLRRIKSAMIANSILDLPVVIRGKNWNHISFTGKKAKYDPRSDYASTADLIDSAPIVLDMSPNTSGPHDRISRLVGHWTAFLTNSQPYFSQHYTDLNSYFTFKFDPADIHQKVAHYIDNPHDAIDLGIAQSKLFRSLHNEDNYVETISSIIDIVAFGLTKRPPGTQVFIDFPPHKYQFD